MTFSTLLLIPTWEHENCKERWPEDIKYNVNTTKNKGESSGDGCTKRDSKIYCIAFTVLWLTISKVAEICLSARNNPYLFVQTVQH
ncbi:hypothetical protein V1477_017052 [Vespula maculifrons]|uniref:Uncharacterized protein n=1 Tax=Vespula maculifrons TaxID=7453 RepID=A0ABD2B521_VESMC